MSFKNVNEISPVGLSLCSVDSTVLLRCIIWAGIVAPIVGLWDCGRVLA